MLLHSIISSLGAIALSRRIPSKRALATIGKLCGRQPTRRWPFLPKVDARNLNLGFDDLLELQHARSRKFVALVVGAFDGVANDPTHQFIRKHQCRAILVEPQPGAFNRLRENMRGHGSITLLNAAIDEVSGYRDMYYVSPSDGGLPPWSEQLASFRREHIVKHEHIAPGLSEHIKVCRVATMTFDELLSRYDLDALDLLQLDAEGMDAQLLAWFPFHRLKPALVHYETVHMSTEEQRLARKNLQELGYIILPSESSVDDMAILF